MRNLLFAGVAALALTAGVAVPQTTESTTTQSTTMAPDPNVPPPVAAPPAGTLSTTRETHAVDAYGNQTDSKASAYRNSNGVADDSTTTTTTMPAPPPPPPVTTSTTTTDTTTGPH